MSIAIGQERVSAVVGYTLATGNFSETSPNLPQRIAILAEANTANQATLNTAPQELISAQQAGNLYGFGSPIHQIMRILKPVSGDGVGGIPIVVYPQVAAVGSTARVQTITVTGTATESRTHKLSIAGRSVIDGYNYEFNIVSGDTATAIATKIADAINAVLVSPVSASSSSGVVTITTKWTGLTSQDVSAEVNNGGFGAGITYAVAQTTAGSGTPAIVAALALFGSAWNTIVINSYGTVTTVMDALETFNGIPDNTTPTGRYTGIIMKPFIAITGSTAADPSTITDPRKANVTIAIAPAPNSKGLPMEAAANMTVLFARVSQDTPHLDVLEKFYPDMPSPSSIGVMSTYDGRDAIVKKGCSTVDLVDGRYQVKDFVTTYHPDGEAVPQFRWCRTLMLDYNVKYGYYLLEQTNVVGHALANDNGRVSATKVVKPKQWKQVLNTYAEDLVNRGLIADAPFMQSSLQVNISATNPDRFETHFKYKRSGFLRQSATTATAGFNFGNI